MAENFYHERWLTITEKRNAVVGIVGLGYVGLPLSLSFAEAGFRVIGFDIDPTKIKLLNNRQTYIAHIREGRIRGAIDDGGLEATSDFSRASEADALIICVPTPLTKNGEPDVSHIINTRDALLPHLRAGQLLSLESTTYPGTTDELLCPPIRKRGFIIGHNFFVVYSPEREDPGNPVYDTKNIPKVLGGHTRMCTKIGIALYRQVIGAMVEVSSTRVAEMVKLVENTYRLVNIALANELKMVADHMGLNIIEVINGAATKPFGFHPFYPGPGIGGHCIPIDPFYLTWKAKTFGTTSRLIDLAGEINDSMPGWVISKLEKALAKFGKTIQGASILALGVTYKKNIDDVRESPALEVMKLLRDRGAKLSFSDPHVETLPDFLGEEGDLKSQPVSWEILGNQDAVVLLTDHSAFDYEFIRAYSRLIIDTRSAFGLGPNIIKA